MSLKRLFKLLLIVLVQVSCSDKNSPTTTDCTSNPVNAPSVVATDASSCTATDGTLTISVSGGNGPYQFSLNGGAFQTTNVFSGLVAGNYQVTAADSRGCTAAKTVTINAAGSTLAATANTTSDTHCFPPHDGTMTILPTGGTPPYEVKVNNGAFSSSASFTGLDADRYTVAVRDAVGCSVTIDVDVLRGDTGVSYATDIQPILNSFCNFPACHGSGNGTRSWTTYANVSASAQNIKLRTGAKSMPPAGNASLSAEQIQLIACWVDNGAKNN